MTSINVHGGKDAEMRAYSLDGSKTVVLQCSARTQDWDGHRDHVELTVFMNEGASLEKLKRAAAAFNAVMTETVPAAEAEAA
jgi:hypothetical protein